MALSRISRQNLLVLGSTRGRVVARDLRTFYTQFMRNDWSEPVRFTTHWKTDLSRSFSNLREESQSMVTRATHTIEARTLGWDNTESFQHYIGAIQSAQARYPIPLYCDRARLSGAASSNFIPCDPLYRRFYEGQRVALVQKDFQKVDITGVQAFAEYGIITGIDSTGITLEDPTIVNWQKDDWIYPMLDCHPIVTTDGTLHTNHHLATNIIATERGGMSALPPTYRNRVKSIWNYDDQCPVVSFNEWNVTPELSIEAQGSIHNSGKGSIENIQGDFPLIRWTFTAVMESRKQVWDLLSLFDASRGRGRQIFLHDPLDSFNVQNYSSTYIEVDPVDNLESFNDGWVEWIAIDHGDRQRVVRRVNVAGEQNGGATFRINYSPGYTNTNPLVRATIGHRCRFAEDSLTIEWITDEIARAQFSFLSTRASDGIAFIKNKPSAYTNIGTG